LSCFVKRGFACKSMRSLSIGSLESFCPGKWGGAVFRKGQTTGYWLFAFLSGGRLGKKEKADKKKDAGLFDLVP